MNLWGSTLVSRTRRGALRASMSSIAIGVVVAGMVSAGAVSFSLSAAHADDSSAQTVSARVQDSDAVNAPFPDLKVTVSQTRGLEAQGIVLNWEGAKQSTVPNDQIGGTNFLQIFQCWGDDPANPGMPDRTTCQYGGLANPGSSRDSDRSADKDVATQDRPFTRWGDGFALSTYTSIPFKPVQGDPIANVVDGKKIEGSDVNTHQYFTKDTTNMVPWAGSGADGTGSVKMELQTAMQSKGLGCGAPITATDGTVSGQSCWLVILPRGSADNGSTHITQSGLFWDVWKHRLAVKLEFKPLGVRCALGTAERQLAGSELVGRAIASWQPVVCNEPGGSVYSAITSAESDAVRAANSTAPAPLALTSRAASTDLGADSLRYAPIAITGATFSFAIDRSPKLDGSVPADVSGRSGLPFTAMKLTPRLVAKLLTYSYLDSLPQLADRSHLGKNPRTLTFDPDFLQINDPEWQHQAIAGESVADALSPLGRSDAAWAVWQYVLSDPSARDFLNGKPDPWGMTVNPWSATDDKVNKTGTALSLPREDFPKADPVEYVSNNAGPINLVTRRPYVTDLDTGAYDTLRGDGLILGSWDPQGTPPKYGKAPRALPGMQRVIAITDAASSARYQVVTAALQNPAGEFVTATRDSMTAAAAVMTADPTQGQIYGFDPTSAGAKSAAGAYPLTMPVYAAANPKMTDATLRASYAAFIRFAAVKGQEPGTALGQLPEGYAPLPSGWRDLAVAAANDIESGNTGRPVTSPQSDGQSFPGGVVSTTTRNQSSAAAAPASAAQSAAAPVASGAPAAALAGGTTPDDPFVGPMAAVLPLSLLGGAAAAVAVPLVTRRRRV
ncbi:hypothetical protein [Microbacterium sp. CJ88]|uniref:hypothetical protein n=1 Tax=Microbacterium sp. CJ88 TaxID=3445672 RepID=UPI003F65C002